MNNRISIVILATVFAISSINASKPFTRQKLTESYNIVMLEPCKFLPEEYYSIEDLTEIGGEWFMAQKIPAMVSDILLAQGVIEEPWLPGKAEEYQWIAENDWVYSMEFSVEEPERVSFLLFEGLDGIVDVYLNGDSIASHSNMFLPLRIDVSGKLAGDNHLILHFHTIYNQFEGKRSPIRSVDGDPERPVRRPQQNYGNYLGPNPNWSRVGVFGQIYLEQTGGSSLDEMAVVSSLNENLSQGSLRILVSGTTAESNVTLNLILKDLEGNTVQSMQKTLHSNEGSFEEDLTLSVDNPELWWPRGYGGQSLYKLKADLIVDGEVHQVKEKTIGFRRLFMKDTLHFEVNNVPVKLWGGDWVTPHWKTAVWDHDRASKLFDMAENANFNAFRVWGVVESPPDDFYEMAAERGFLLWQDFTVLPLGADAGSIEICKRESTFLLKRLMNYPSIVVWCGGNENAMWHHQEFNGRLVDRGPWPGVASTDEIRKICHELDPERLFFPSSPYFGIDPNDPAEGNTHGYTNMWFIPGYEFLNFASEDTRIAAPVLHSMERFMRPEEIWPEDYSPIYSHGNKYPYPESWLRYTSASSWRKTGPVEQFFDATDAASLVYRIGMAEALYYRDVIERQRRGRPATDLSGERCCGGYLVWKFNDSWPQVYSAKVDYFLEPYHTYYTLKRSYQPLMLSFEMGPYIYLWVVNDGPEAFEGEVEFHLLHIHRNQARKKLAKKVYIPPGESRVVIDLYKEGVGTFHLDHVLFARLNDNMGQQVAVTHAMPDIERAYTYPDARLEVSVEDGVLIITTDKFAKSVTLSGNANGNEFGWFFEDNYFDLVPGEVKKVKILGDHNSGMIRAKAWYSPLETTVNWSR